MERPVVQGTTGESSGFCEIVENTGCLVSEINAREWMLISNAYLINQQLLDQSNLKNNQKRKETDIELKKKGN